MAVSRARQRAATNQLPLFAPEEIPATLPPLRFCVLGSGSSGNAVVVESGRSRLLIDAGFSARELSKRLRDVGVDPRSLGGLVLTHEHGDHVRGANRLAHRLSLPLWGTVGTLEGTQLTERVRQFARPLRSGNRQEVAGFEIEPFTVPHDAREPIGLVIRDSYGRSLGLVADLGMRSRLAWGRLRDLDALILEANYDLEMLRHGPYPWSLKQRVAGNHGHLSNRDAALGLDELVSERLRTIVLYHLSRTNNTPDIALREISERLSALGSPAEVVVSSQHQPTGWLEVRTQLELGWSLPGGTLDAGARSKS